MPRRRPSTSSIYAYAEDLRKAMLVEYRLHQEAEFAAAEEATHGYMARNGRRGWDVFFGPPNVFEAHATEELKTFGRGTTRTQFEKQWLDNYLGGNDD